MSRYQNHQIELVSKSVKTKLSSTKLDLVQNLDELRRWEVWSRPLGSWNKTRWKVLQTKIGKTKDLFQKNTKAGLLRMRRHFVFAPELHGSTTLCIFVLCQFQTKTASMQNDLINNDSPSMPNINFKKKGEPNMFLQVSKDELSKLCLDLSDYIQLYSNRWLQTKQKDTFKGRLSCWNGHKAGWQIRFAAISHQK